MKFQFLFEDILSDMAMDEARGASDVQFDKFAKTAGSEIANICNHVVTRIFAMPGYQSFKNYVEGIPTVDVSDPVSMVLNVEKYYDSWINSLSPKESNKIHRATKDFIAKYKEKGTAGRPAGGKNKPKDNVDKAVQGLDYTPNEPEITTEPEMAIEPKVRGGARPGAGRPKLPAELKKVYVPTGKPKGRPSIPDELKKKYVPTGAPRGGVRVASNQLQDLISQMRDMQAQIQALKDELKNKNESFGDEDTNPQIAEMNESLHYMKKQYMRFF